MKLLFDQVVTELFVLDTPVEELMTRMDGAKAHLDIEDDAAGFVIQQIRAEAAVTEGNDDTDK